MTEGTQPTLGAHLTDDLPWGLFLTANGDFKKISSGAISRKIDFVSTSCATL